jgi:hypothetical protein
MRIQPRIAAILILPPVFSAPGGGAGAATMTNDGTISGDWEGTADPDTMTNSGTVTGSIYGEYNSDAYSSGGGNTIPAGLVERRGRFHFAATLPGNPQPWPDTGTT